VRLEMIHGNQTASARGDVYVEPPSWLVEGLLALTPNRARRSLVNALAVSERVTPLNEFLRERLELLDPAGRLLHRAYSFALLQLLVEPADGHARLGRFIDNLSFASNDPSADLLKVFPQLAFNGEGNWKSKIAESKNSG